MRRNNWTFQRWYSQLIGTSLKFKKNGDCFMLKAQCTRWPTCFFLQETEQTWHTTPFRILEMKFLDLETKWIRFRFEKHCSNVVLNNCRIFWEHFMNVCLSYVFQNANISLNFVFTLGFLNKILRKKIRNDMKMLIQ